ncbi:MAG: hypothetical protein J1E00_01825 [Oscillospiraceae bacterium]|nr:hypothetical protein [Oscillospiraceae bacterium]
MNEELYERALRSCAEEICGNSDLKLVLIAGGSCSGKTTTTGKLARLIRGLGRPVDTISLDDYYRNPENAVYLPNGMPDFEGIQSLRLDLLQDTMRRISAGEEAPIPFFDFTLHRRTDDYRMLKPLPGGIIIVEGLHALNPQICGADTPPEAIYRIYLYADSGDGEDCRFLRRLVRDSRYRASNAAETYANWETVRGAEKVTIEPFAKLANRSINTFFEYERSILADDAVAVLKGLSSEDPHFHQAQALIELLSAVPLLPDDAVPEDSLLREFI